MLVGKVVKQCRLDQVKENEFFRLIGANVVWKAHLVGEISLLAISDKRNTTFVFDKRYNGRLFGNATKADRQVQIIEYQEYFT